MASPNATFTELVSTTFRKHGKTFIDNVSKNNAMLRYLMDKGGFDTIDGGLSIVRPLDYNSNATYQRYSGYDVLNVSPSDVLTSAEYQWRQIAINVVASGLEMRINKGDSRIIALVKSRIKNAIRTFKNNFSVDLYSDGTLPNQIGGLQVIVSDLGTGVVGGIDSGSWPFWQNKVQSAAAPMQGGGAIVPSALTIEGLMLPLYLEQTRGDDQPDLVVSSNDFYTFFEQSQTSMKRYNDTQSAKAGFVALQYKKADVIFDGNSGIPASHMYFLNTDYLAVVVHEDANMSVLDEVKPYNQDAAVIPVLWMGNLTCSNRSLQGVLKNYETKMFAPVTPYVGVQPFNDWFAPDTIGRMQLGMTLSAVDPYWGGGDFIYVKSNDAIIKGAFCAWDELWQATLLANAANQGFPVGVAMAPMTAGKFGWLQLTGLAVYKVAASVAADAPVGIGGVGAGGAFSAGKQLVNVRNRRPSTTAITKNAQQQAGSPVLRTSGYDGFFLGMALSGTGIPANTVVGALDPDGMRIYSGSAIGVTGDKNSTATGNIVLTGTYTGYCGGLLQFPFAQGAIT